MGAAVILVVILFIVIGAIASPKNNRNRLLQNGLPARGILLAVQSAPVGSIGIGLNKLQQRVCVMDVEIPGRPPYEVTVTALIPLNLVRDVLPGATVELRVSKSNPTDIAIVGPGVGFNPALLITQGNGS